MKIAIYPGTFDPVTAGHLDVMHRALKVFDNLIVAVAEDSSKNTMFTALERVEMIKYDLASHNLMQGKSIEVTSFEGLLVDFAISKKTNVIIRGLRAVSDFEYEFQMSCMNSKLNDDVQTIFIPSTEKLQFISSKLVKEVLRLKGDIGDFVSTNTAENIRSKFFK